ncbi:Coiled-coil and C2 domain-containing protein 2A [Allomyces arbusculus]|nr:Coiled-coil and C2 domain-containing protein 2A [Allomyces arbusculus]
MQSLRNRRASSQAQTTAAIAPTLSVQDESQALFQLGNRANELPSTVPTPSGSDASPDLQRHGDLLNVSLSEHRRRKFTDGSVTSRPDQSGPLGKGLASLSTKGLATPKSATLDLPVDEFETLLASLSDYGGSVVSLVSEAVPLPFPMWCETKDEDPVVQYPTTIGSMVYRHLQEMADRGEVVPSYPPLSLENQALFEQRWLQPDSIGSDVTVGSSPHLFPHDFPIRYDRTVHPCPLTSSSLLTTTRPAKRITDPTYRRLRLKLFHVVFHDHPLMIEENRLSAALANAVVLHQERRASGQFEYLTARIHATISAYRRGKRALQNLMTERPDTDSPVWQAAVPNEDPSAQLAFIAGQDREYILTLLASIHELCAQLAEVPRLRRERHTLVSDLGRIEDRIVELWEQLAAVRKAQKFTSTANMLVGYDVALDNDRIVAPDESFASSTAPGGIASTHRAGGGNDWSVVMETEERDVQREVDEWSFLSMTEQSLLRVLDPDAESASMPCSKLPPYHPAQTYLPSGLQFRFTPQMPITFTGDCPVAEQARRVKLEAATFAFTVAVDDVPVTTVEEVGIVPENMAVVLNQTFDIMLDTDQLSHLTVVLTERGLFNDRLIARILVPVVYSTHQEGFHRIQFASDDGAIQGAIQYQLVWDQLPPSIPLAPSAQAIPPSVRALPNPLTLDPHAAVACAKSVKVPTDHLLAKQVHELVKDAHMVVLPATHVEVLPAIEMLPVPSVVDARRHELLAKRFQKQIVANSPVPLDAEVMRYQFQEAQPQSRELKALLESRNDLGMGKFAALARRIQIRQLQMSGALAREQHHDDFVREVKLPHEEQDINLWEELVRPRRPLRPIKREPKRVSLDSNASGEYDIVVQVRKGYYLPSRVRVGMSRPSSPSAAAADSGDEAAATDPAYLFVQAEFQRTKARTATAEGPHPEWNSTLTLPTTIHNVDSLPNGMVHINIFDEQTVDMLEDDRLRDRGAFVVMEARWIGCIRVPFVVLCEQGRIMGRFPIELPDHLNGFAATRKGIDEPPALELFLLLDPAFALGPRLRQLDDVPSIEDESLLAYTKRWLRYLPRSGMVSDPTHSRFALAVVTDLNGSLVHVCRFLRALAPPPGITTADQAAHFVSLIPTLSDRLSIASGVHLWGTCDHFLALGAGDGMEHALLLVNYLLHLGLDAYLVLGSAIPEGPTAHVMYFPPSMDRDDVYVDGPPDPVFVQPMSAKTYALRSARAHVYGLSLVGCVIGPDNVWLNTQAQDVVALLRFDLEDSRDWRPFFQPAPSSEPENGRARKTANTNSSAPTKPIRGLYPRPTYFASVQPALLVYTPIPSRSVRTLEKRLEGRIMQQVEAARRQPTRWNRLLCRVLQSLVATIELDPPMLDVTDAGGTAIFSANPYATPGAPGTRRHSRQPSDAGKSRMTTIDPADRLRMQNEYLAELHKMGTMQHLAAFPLHFAFTDEDTIVDAIHSTRFWEVEDASAELAVAVRCVGYCNGIVSVWVYLACLTRARYASSRMAAAMNAALAVATVQNSLAASGSRAGTARPASRAGEPVLGIDASGGASDLQLRPPALGSVVASAFVPGGLGLSGPS